jgi:protein phosphatase PTC7
LILHFWAIAVEEASASSTAGAVVEPDAVGALQTAYERTMEATGEHNWQGTTTVCGAHLHYTARQGSDGEERIPTLYVTNLGDSQVMVLRPQDREIIFKTKEQWHWFDCPRQLGTNSPDTPKENAVVDKVDLAIGDVVLAMTDGVIDNLWEHEIADLVFTSIHRWETNGGSKGDVDGTGGRNGGMEEVARNIVAAAKQVALDPYAESPYMEHAIEEGLASEGGKLDDISVVAALCVRS